MTFNFDFPPAELEEQESNMLMQYLQAQHPDTLARVAQSVSSEIKEIVTHNVQGLVGMLPMEDFNVQITTDRENLANLLASAMMTGYFLSQMEQRRDLEATLYQSDSFQDEFSEGDQFPGR
jgi:23S rRNA G2069 N7-methylase RlmK/C1962 C5-methylase RlmI